MPNHKRILVVDDEPEILETTKWALELAGFEVHTAASAEEALPQAEALQPEILLIDYKLPRQSGLEVLKTVKSLHPEAIAIMITGLTHESEFIEQESRRLGAVGFLHKPLQMDRVLQIVNDEMQKA